MYQHIRPYMHPRFEALFATPQLLFQVTGLHEGPVHLLMPEIMEENVQVFQKAFEELGIEGELRYAHKTNKSPALVRQAKQLGIGIDVASERELCSALCNGYTGKDISCSGPKGKKFLLLALQHGCLISIDSVSELHTIIALAQRYGITGVELLVRINDLAGTDRVLKKKNTKFGMDQQQLAAVVALVQEHEFLSIKGLHFHFDEFDPGIKGGAIENVLTLFQELYGQGMAPTIIDIGGGFRGRELVTLADWEGYIDFLSECKRNNLPTDTWGERAYGVHLNERGSIEGREVMTRRYRELDNGHFLRSILTTLHEDGQPLYKNIGESMFTVMLEPGYSLAINTGCTVLRVEALKTLANGDQAIVVNGNILSLASRMWEYYLDPLHVPQQVEQESTSFYGYILGNLCRDDDVLIQRKVHFDHMPKVGDLIVFMNTAAYSSDFEDGSPIQQEGGKKFVVRAQGDSFQFFEEASTALL